MKIRNTPLRAFAKSSPMNKKTDKVPTSGPTDAGLPGDIETSKERAYRGLSKRGNVVDILRKRKELNKYIAKKNKKNK
tara:strand:- start:1001 stop:1234 length:234 start_codon:yes stop_codon:yes gene_type:complete